MGPHTPAPIINQDPTPITSTSKGLGQPKEIPTQTSTPPPPPPRGWDNQGDSSYPTSAPSAPGLTVLGLLDETVHAFTSALQGVMAAGVGAALPSPSPSATSGRVAALSIIHLCFECGVEGDLDLPPI